MPPMTSLHHESFRAGAPAHQGAQGAERRRPGRPRAGSEDKRERILNEAVALFGARGYAGTSLAEIAAAADISKAGLLHHFSSKEHLYTQVLDRRDIETRGLVGAGDPEQDPWSTLRAFIRLVEHNTGQRKLVSIYTATAISVLDADHPAHAWLTHHLEGTVAMLEEAFERGKALGTVRPEAPSRLIARTVTALSDGLQIQWLCSTTPGTAASQRLATDMVEEFNLYVADLEARWRP